MDLQEVHKASLRGGVLARAHGLGPCNSLLSRKAQIHQPQQAYFEALAEGRQLSAGLQPRLGNQRWRKDYVSDAAKTGAFAQREDGCLPNGIPRHKIVKGIAQWLDRVSGRIASTSKNNVVTVVNITHCQRLLIFGMPPLEMQAWAPNRPPRARLCL